jgi:hypothetical protein
MPQGEPPRKIFLPKRRFKFHRQRADSKKQVTLASMAALGFTIESF